MNFDFPKIDLHLHLDGAISPELMLRLAQARGIDLGADTPEALTPIMTAHDGCDSVNEYLKKFEIPTAVLQDREALACVAYELVLELERQGLAYAEIRFAPQLHTRKGMTQREAVEAVEDGVRSALEECSRIRIGIILCAMCIGPASLNHAENMETAHLAFELRNDLVVGFDLAGAEGVCPLSDFEDLFTFVGANGVPFTCHAGDSQGADTVRTAIENFGARRIGHGHHVVQDPAVVELARNRGTTFEICLTSNIQCKTEPSYEAHPAKKMLDAGLKVTLNTDNPVIAGVTLDSEYQIALDRCGFTYLDLIRMNLYALEASFLDPQAKQALRSELEALLLE